MIIRPIELQDMDDINKIHKEQYEHEFELPDFNKHFISTFLVTTDAGDIVSAGGLKTILESVLITDKTFSTRVRRDALMHILQGSLYMAKRASHNELHCYVQDENWIKILNKVGFHPTRGQSLVAMW